MLFWFLVFYKLQPTSVLLLSDMLWKDTWMQLTYYIHVTYYTHNHKTVCKLCCKQDNVSIRVLTSLLMIWRLLKKLEVEHVARWARWSTDKQGMCWQSRYECRQTHYSIGIRDWLHRSLKYIPSVCSLVFCASVCLSLGLIYTDDFWSAIYPMIWVVIYPTCVNYLWFHIDFYGELYDVLY